MAKVLLLDLNVAAGPLLTSLRGAGHDVYVVGRNPSEGLGRSYEKYIEHDYSDAPSTLRLFEKGKFDYLVPGCNDRSYQTCAEIKDALSLPGVDGLEVTRIINNKAAFRRWSQERGFPAPRTIEPQDVQADVAVIVKPEESYSGRGATVLRAPTRASLDAAMTVACSESRSGRCLVENFIEGQLFSHSAFCAGGRVLADVVVEEHGSANPLVVDTSHVAVEFSGTLTQRMRRLVASIFAELGLQPGLIHTQMIVQGNEIFVIEMTRRCPGDLYSLLIQMSTGLDYAAQYVRPFLGESLTPEAPKQYPNPILRHTVSSRTNVSFGALRFLRSLMIDRWVPLTSSCEVLRASPFSRVGHLFIRAVNFSELKQIKNECLERRLYTIQTADQW